MPSADYFSLAIISFGIFYSLYLCSSIPKNVFFNGDGAMKGMLARQFSNLPFTFDFKQEVDPWVSHLWQEGLSPYKPPFVYSLDERYYISFPFPFSWLTSIFYKFLGYRGLYIIPLLSTWILWLSFYAMTTFLGVETWQQWLSLTILVAASPLILYGAMYWEHSLAVLCGFVGAALFFLLPDYANLGVIQPLLGGIIVGLSAWFRSECLALIAALTLLTVLESIPDLLNSLTLLSSKEITLIDIIKSNEQSLDFIGGMVVSILLLWLLNKLIYNRFLGIHALLVLDEFSWSQRLKEAWMSFKQLNSSFPKYFPVVLFPLSYLLVWGLQQLEFLPSHSFRLIALAVVFGLTFTLVYLIQGLRQLKNLIKNNLLPLVWLVSACVILEPFELVLTQRMIFIYLLYVSYTVGVSCLVDFAPGETIVGGKQWGPRYLLPTIPFITLLSILQIQVLGQNNQTLLFNGTVSLLLILVAMGMSKNLYEGMSFFLQSHRGIAPAIVEIEKDDSSVVAFSNQLATQALGFGLESKKTFFCVESTEEMIKLCQGLLEKNISRFLFIRYPYAACQLLQSPSQNLTFDHNEESFKIEISKIGNFGKYPAYEVISSLNNALDSSSATTESQSVAKPLVCTVLPTYNERDNITQLVQRLLDNVSLPYIVLVVDDDSPDGTWKVVEEMAQQHSLASQKDNPESKIILRRRTDEKGLTSALQRGIDDAINIYGATIVTWMDCDLSMPPEDVPKLIEPIQNNQADVVVGSRWIPGGNDIAHGLMARTLSWIINRTAMLFLGNQVHDYTSGFIAIRSDVVEKIRLEGDYGEYCIDLLGKTLYLGHKLVEVPYQCVPRIYGESKTGINLWDYLYKGRKYVTTIWRLRNLFSSGSLLPKKQ